MDYPIPIPPNGQENLNEHGFKTYYLTFSVNHLRRYFSIMSLMFFKYGNSSGRNYGNRI